MLPPELQPTQVRPILPLIFFCLSGSSRLVVLSLFGHYPESVIIGEGRDVDRPENRELRFCDQLSFHHDRPI